MMIGFAGAVFLAVIAALPFGAIGWFRGEPIPEAAARRLVLLLSLLFAASYLAAGVWKIQAWQMGMWDFGIYDSMLHIAASGGPLMHDYRGPFDHFSPTVLLLLPLYWVWDSPYILAIVQPLVMAAAAPVYYLAALRMLKKPAPALLVALLYLCYPYTARLALYDFHIECLFPLWLAAAFLCRAHGKHGWFLLLAATVPLIKEDFIIPLGALGLWLLSQRGFRLQGVLLLAAGLFWTGFVLGIYYPYILKASYLHAGRYELFAPTVAETLTNAWKIASHLFLPTVPVVLISVLLPLAFLPCFSWRGFLFLFLPTLAIQLVSTDSHQQLLVSHYGSAVAGVAPIAALLGLRELRALCRRFRRPLRQRRAALAVAAALGVSCHVLFADLVQMRYATYDNYVLGGFGSVFSWPLRPGAWRELAEYNRHAAFLDEIAARVPLDAQVAAQNELGIPFTRHRQIVTVRHPVADIYLFDRKNYYAFEPQEFLNEILTRLMKDPLYQLIHYPEEGVILFIHRSRPDLLAAFEP